MPFSCTVLHLATLAASADDRSEMTSYVPRAQQLNVLLALAFLSLPAVAQPAPKRLSTWLLEQPKTPDAYPLGLSWRDICTWYCSSPLVT